MTRSRISPGAVARRGERRPRRPGPPAADRAPRALLALSRGLAGASDEQAIARATALAVEALFPGRRYCLRLLEAGSLAVSSLHARGALRAGAAERVALRRSAARRTGLSEADLAAAGALLGERDEPIFEGASRSSAVPLAASGALFGLLHLERPLRSRAARRDDPLLLLVANQAALALKNLRSLGEATQLKAYLEDLIENANALIAVVSREREVMVFNRALAGITGRAAEEVLGEDLASLVPAPERAALSRLLERAFAGEAAAGAELRLAVAGGGEARVQASTSPIYGASGEVEGVLLIGQDQTLLRALQERAEHAQKLAEVGRLAAGVAHEINNPLTAVTAYAQALLAKLAPLGHDGADLEKLRRILEAGQRIQRLSHDLVAYARPPAQRAELVDVAQLMEQAARMCEPALASARVRLERRFEPVPQIRGERGGLVQVFVNLLTNAAHALEPDGGTVTLEVSRSGGHVAARVKDDGAGMAPEVKRRAFEPFFTTKGDGKGTGLGLSIVQGIVARHGGAVDVESEPGAGAAFTVLLPVYASVESTAYPVKDGSTVEIE